MWIDSVLEVSSPFFSFLFSSLFLSVPDRMDTFLSLLRFQVKINEMRELDLMFEFLFLDGLLRVIAVWCWKKTGDDDACVLFFFFWSYFFLFLLGTDVHRLLPFVGKMQIFPHSSYKGLLSSNLIDRRTTKETGKEKSREREGMYKKQETVDCSLCFISIS